MELHSAFPGGARIHFHEFIKMDWCRGGIRRETPVKMETLLQNAWKNYVAEVDACFKKMTADYAAKKIGSWADRASVGGTPPTREDAIRAMNEVRTAPRSWWEYEEEGVWMCEALDAKMIKFGEWYRIEDAWKRADAAAASFVKECRRERLSRGWRDGDDYKYGRD